MEMIANNKEKQTIVSLLAPGFFQSSSLRAANRQQPANNQPKIAETDFSERLSAAMDDSGKRTEISGKVLEKRELSKVVTKDSEQMPAAVSTNPMPAAIESDAQASTSGVEAAILISITLLTLLDIGVDLMQGVALVHIWIEAAVIPLAGTGLYFVWRGLERAQSENNLLRRDLTEVANRAADWKHEAARYVDGLSAAIDSQLTRWQLTTSEKDIALLLLKGMSHKEIAAARQTKERTVRHQSLAGYAKSGLDGRAHLAAYFLEDLLTPLQAEEEPTALLSLRHSL